MLQKQSIDVGSVEAARLLDVCASVGAEPTLVVVTAYHFQSEPQISVHVASVEQLSKLAARYGTSISEPGDPQTDGGFRYASVLPGDGARLLLVAWDKLS